MPKYSVAHEFRRVTRCMGSASSEWRRNEDSPCTMRFAVALSPSSTSVEMALRVLNRKCGLSW